ncbi:MAG: flagellar biosynthesis protein [Deltaproteobacteria bacterium]|nr:MAG: flagellar biosynthesis protein [Deltaproteobacteria bacterium]RLB76340.1 MAG: flagellar biosynthesis protein [Deltaproteobacteria bacterium]
MTKVVAGGAIPRPQPERVGPTTPAGGFAEALQQACRRQERVRLSAHARQRLQDHRLAVDGAMRRKLDRALDLARAKGIRQTLVVTAEARWILSVPQQTVITVLPQDGGEAGVFSNIDGAILLD